jgi:hypothetical protein
MNAIVLTLAPQWMAVMDTVSRPGARPSRNDTVVTMPLLDAVAAPRNAPARPTLR